MSTSSHGDSKSVIIVALLINVTIAAFKTLCAIVTGSSAMLSESVHSFVDCGNQILMLLGMRESKRKPTAQHPLGYHRSTYIYAFLVPTMIFIGGASTSIYEGIQKILHPEPLSAVPVFGYHVPAWAFNLTVLTVSIVLEGIGFRNAWSAFRRSHRGPMLRAMNTTKDTGILISVLEDGGAVIGLGFTVVFTILTAITHNTLYDGIGAITVGLMLLMVAYFLGRETKSLAIGENNPTICAAARKIAQANPFVTRINECMALHQGPEHVLVIMSIDWNDDTPAGKIEESTMKMEQDIRRAYPSITRVYIDTRSTKDIRPNDIVDNLAA